MRIIVKPSSVLRYLLVIILLLVIAGVTFSYLKHATGSNRIMNIDRVFDLDGEANIPSFYSALALLAASLLLMFIAFSNRKVKRDFLAWLLLGVVFMYLSFDEAAMLHEMLIGTFRRTFHLSGLFYNAWVIPYGILMVAGGILYLPFLLRLPRPILLLFLVSGAIFITGAAGVEMIEGKYEAVFGTDNFTYDLYVAVEEGMEMAGIALFIYALLKYISLTSRELTISVADPE